MSIGKLMEFSVRSRNWTLYVEQAEMYFKVNQIKEELWLPTLIAAMGDEAYELLSNLTSPAKSSDRTYAIVTQVMKEHLQPKPSFMAERYRFRERRQQAGESIPQYISELKKIARYCKFKTVLEENLRYQLVCGLSSETFRQRVFTEEDVVYSKAVKIACGPRPHRAAPVAMAVASIYFIPGLRGSGAVPRPEAARALQEHADQTPGAALAGAETRRILVTPVEVPIIGLMIANTIITSVADVDNEVTYVRCGCGAGGLLAHVETRDLELDMGCVTDLSGDDESPSEDEELEIEEDLYQCLNGYKPV